eukprot:gene9513-10396_t
MLPRCITNDPWPWLRIPCWKRVLPTTKRESLFSDVSAHADVDDNDLQIEETELHEVKSESTPPDEIESGSVVKLSESQRFRDELGRRIAMSRKGELDHARHRWNVAVWQVLTQLDVVDTMRRHHR